MKRILIAVLMLVAASPAFAGKRDRDPTKEPGYFDFGQITSYSNGEETVEVHLTQPLLTLVQKVMEKEDPELGTMVADLLLVKVNVFSYDESDFENLEKDVDKISTKLSDDGWQRLVKVKQNDERVFLYLKPIVTGSGDEERDVIAGLVVVVLGSEDNDKPEAVFVNVVGNFDIEAIAGLVDHFDVPHITEGDLEEMGVTIRRSNGDDE